MALMKLGMTNNDNNDKKKEDIKTRGMNDGKAKHHQFPPYIWGARSRSEYGKHRKERILIENETTKLNETEKQNFNVDHTWQCICRRQKNCAVFFFLSLALCKILIYFHSVTLLSVCFSEFFIHRSCNDDQCVLCPFLIYALSFHVAETCREIWRCFRNVFVVCSSLCAPASRVNCTPIAASD